MNPDCPCEQMTLFDTCKLCYRVSLHLETCDCPVRIRGALADAQALVDKYDRAIEKIVEANR